MRRTLMKTIEDRFVPRDNGCFMAQGRNEGRQRKLAVIASAARQSSLFLTSDRLIAPGNIQAIT